MKEKFSWGKKYTKMSKFLGIRLLEDFDNLCRMCVRFELHFFLRQLAFDIIVKTTHQSRNNSTVDAKKRVKILEMICAICFNRFTKSSKSISSGEIFSNRIIYSMIRCRAVLSIGEHATSRI